MTSNRPQKFMTLFFSPVKARRGPVDTTDKPRLQINGIFFIYGKEQIATRNVNASIVDIVPTILALQHVAIPTNLDGSIIKDAFQQVPKTVYTDQYITKETKLMHAELTAIQKLKGKI